MTSLLRSRSRLAAALALLFALCMRVETQSPKPRPVRNDVPRPVRELLVLRNHQLKPGGHEPFYQFSRDAYWPFFARLGARVVGQWNVIAPDGRGSESGDDVYRLVRYASFQHWQATCRRCRSDIVPEPCGRAAVTE